MPSPKWVVSMGTCASCGGILNNYAIVPMDVYVPGCPPSPDALIYALIKLQQKIRTQRLGMLLELNPRQKPALESPSPTPQLSEPALAAGQPKEAQ